jgi:hypothetical protein
VSPFLFSSSTRNRTVSPLAGIRPSRRNGTTNNEQGMGVGGATSAPGTTRGSDGRQSEEWP